jgi:hypothetical protein
LRLSFSESRKTLDWQAEFAAPLLLGLPEKAVAPAPAGPLGLGGNYFSANDRERHAAMLFPKQLNIRFKGLFSDERQSLKLGRFEFNDGTELAPKDPALAAVKRDRITQRLIGNFGWTHVGRSIDGFHYVANSKVSLHVLGGFPTRGVFQVDGWGPLRAAFLYASVNRGGAAFDWRLFGIYYHDFRRILKIDNRPVALRRGDLDDIRIGTYGGHYIRAASSKSAGTADFVVWGAFQSGKWGRLDHLAASALVEAGWQPTWGSKMRPWFRGGYSYGSGDANASDQKHNTFFQLLPTPRPYARFPFFNMMNNLDAHGSLTLRPSKVFSIRGEVHALRLASGADLWFQGGGAFQPWSFGYIGRPSGAASGQPGLANLYDVSADWTINPRVSVNLYYGHAQGLRTVESIYRGKDANLGYVELMYKF